MTYEHPLRQRNVRPNVINNFFSRGHDESLIKALTRFIIGQNPRPEDLMKVDNSYEELVAETKDSLTKVKLRLSKALDHYPCVI